MNSLPDKAFFRSPRGEQGQRDSEPLLLTPREAAQRLAISESSLYRLTSSGQVPCVRVGRLVRYSVETLRKWIEDRESAQPPPPPRESQPNRLATQSRKSSVAPDASHRSKRLAARPRPK